MLFATFALSAALSLAPAISAYTLTDNYVGSSFLTGFDHQAIADPTHGRVNYVNQATALSQNLTFASGNTLVALKCYLCVFLIVSWLQSHPPC
jgi:hypothetical protein